MNNSKSVLKKPLIVILAYFWFGFLWYFWGPIDFTSRDNSGLFALITYVSLFFIAFQFGYCVKYKKISVSQMQISETGAQNIRSKVISFLNWSIYVNLLFTLLNALQYSYTTNLSELIDKFLNTLNDPGDAYFDKILTMYDVSTSNSILTYITVFLAPILFPSSVLAIYYFNNLKLHQKIVVVLTVFLEIARWVSIGTNKGLLDVSILVFTPMVIKAIKNAMVSQKDTKQNKQTKKYLIVALIMVILFVVVFLYFLTSRAEGETINFNKYPYKNMPKQLRLPFYKFTSYLCQGYRSLQHIFANVKWEPTWGIGNSTFLLSVFRRVTGIDLEPLTYQARICNTGLVSSGAFQTAFSYFANDLSFPGVVILMFIVGWFTCTIIYESVVEENPISITILYMLILAFFNISCLNYMLSFSNMFIGFWGLFVVRLINKKYTFSWNLRK